MDWGHILSLIINVILIVFLVIVLVVNLIYFNRIWKGTQITRNEARTAWWLNVIALIVFIILPFVLFLIMAVATGIFGATRKSEAAIVVPAAPAAAPMPAPVYMRTASTCSAPPPEQVINVTTQQAQQPRYVQAPVQAPAPVGVPVVRSPPHAATVKSMSPPAPVSTTTYTYTAPSVQDQYCML